jgi:DHA2 family multidrug resistance protein
MLASFPAEKRGFALGLWASTVLTAPIFGPILGGWITDNWSWRTCFFINLPIGLFSTITLAVLLRGRDNKPLKEPVDFVGASLLIVGIVALQFMLDHGNQEAWFESTLIVALAVVSFLALTLFATWERFEPFPIVDFSLFRQGNFAVGVVASSMGYAAFFASMIIHPLWLQTTAGYTATQAGLAVAGYGVMAMATSLLFGTVIHQMPLRLTATFGLLMFAFGAVLLTRLTTESTFWNHVFARVPQGIGMPMFQMSLTAWSMGSLPANRYPAAAGLMSFFRTLGGAFAAALTIWAWDYRSAVHHSLLAEGLNTVRAADVAGFLEMQRTGESVQSLAIIEALAQMKARTLAFADVSWITAGLFMAIIATLWLVPVKKAAP